METAMNDALSPYALTTLTLFGGVATVLLLASAVGALLRHAVARGRPHAVIDNLTAARQRLVGDGRRHRCRLRCSARTGVMLLFTFISFYALREFVTLLNTRRADHPAIATAFFVVLPLQYAFAWTGWYGMFSIFIPVYAFLLLPILAALGGDTQRFLERTSKVQWGLMVSVFCISHVPALVTLDIPGYEGRNLLLIAFLVIVVQGSDVLQYVWGKLSAARRRARAVAVQDLGGPGRRRGQRHRTRCGAALDHAVLAAAGRGHQPS
jgi:phosphatidate cytidylyltransferase